MKSTNPFGLYLSSKSREAAQYWIFLHAIDFVSKRELLLPEPGGGYSHEQVDWEKALRESSCDIIIRTLTKDAVQKGMSSLERVTFHPEPKLHADWWQGQNMPMMCVVRDDGDKNTVVDGEWLLNSMRRDLIAAGHAPKDRS